MAKNRSALKRAEIIRKRTLRNRALRSTLRTAIKRFETSLSAGAEDVSEKLRKALVTIDKAVTKGILHKNAAARKKSRLMKKFNAAS
ncbi:MAG: 30S ribosomal protein S20 [Thermoanaerobacterales bacterium]|nr:30S ribosomal protein S20 [Bacillota bacterium]MDI6906527.1 30S ribosomal protein S20 [Thermoanaerobacterales bacterium]